MDQFKAPENLVFAGNLHENWRRWEQKLGLYLLASGNNEKDDRTKVAILLHCAGDEAIEIFNNFEFPLKDNGDPDPDDNPDKFEAVLAQFRAYCNPRKNTVIERYKFWMCSQRDGETFDQFVTELRTRAKNCEFGTQTDPMIRDRIIFGINDDRLRERLLRDSADPALSRVIELCRAAEASKKQLQSLQTQSQVPVDSVRVKSTPRGAQKYSETQKTQRHSEHTRPKERIDCKYCGYTHLPRRCPAYGKKCGSCHRKNHFAKMCPSLPKNVSAIHACDSDESDYDLEVDTLFIGELSSDQTRTNKAWFATLGVNGHDVSFKLDTGAEANIVNEKPKALTQEGRRDSQNTERKLARRVLKLHLKLGKSIPSNDPVVVSTTTTSPSVSKTASNTVQTSQATKPLARPVTPVAAKQVLTKPKTTSVVDR
ncbi:hypothetical protein ScPMuIL_014303 [Solemya velum]